MKTRVRKWGNSLALRIPKSFAVDAGLCENAPVELSLVNGSIVVRSVAPTPPSLDEMLRGITDENLHGEWDTGPATAAGHPLQQAGFAVSCMRRIRFLT